MITGLLLLPVLCILTWLYWYLLPQRAWQWADSLILAGVVAAAAAFVAFVGGLKFTGGGPIWSEIVAVTGAYAILALGLAAGLTWRRRGP